MSQEKVKKVMVFVYGSLLSGLYNNRVMKEAKGELVSNASITNAKMFTSNWAYPYIMKTDSESDKVVGELFMVPEDKIPRLDRLEGYIPGRNNNLYDRLIVKAEFPTVDGPVHVDATVYMAGEIFKTRCLPADPIPSGNWKLALEERQHKQAA